MVDGGMVFAGVGEELSRFLVVVREQLRILLVRTETKDGHVSCHLSADSGLPTSDRGFIPDTLVMDVGNFGRQIPRSVRSFASRVVRSDRSG